MHTKEDHVITFAGIFPNETPMDRHTREHRRSVVDEHEGAFLATAVTNTETAVRRMFEENLGQSPDEAVGLNIYEKTFRYYQDVLPELMHVVVKKIIELAEQSGIHEDRYYYFKIGNLESGSAVVGINFETKELQLFGQEAENVPIAQVAEARFAHKWKNSMVLIDALKTKGFTLVGREQEKGS